MKTVAKSNALVRKTNKTSLSVRIQSSDACVVALHIANPWPTFSIQIDIQPKKYSQTAEFLKILLKAMMSAIFSNVFKILIRILFSGTLWLYLLQTIETFEFRTIAFESKKNAFENPPLSFL